MGREPRKGRGLERPRKVLVVGFRGYDGIAPWFSDLNWPTDCLEA